MALNLIMLGAPGAGKGTQAERFAKDRRIPKISTGDILREAVHAGTELGRLAKAIMDRGELVSDDVMIGIVRERLDRPDASAGFILDGFPRTVAQAQALDGLMNGRAPLIVVDIVVPENELVRRLGARLVCSTCGSNATTAEEARSLTCAHCGGPLVQRSDEKTMPLVEYYGNRPTFVSVNGAQALEDVTAALGRAVDEASRNGGGGR